MPTLNEEQYIERALKCLKNQETNVPYEIIICDGLSSDKTAKIAEKYADKIVFEPKKGIANGRNTGIKNSSGKYIINADADTVYPKDFVQKAYEVFSTEKYVGFICGHLDFYDGKYSLIKKILSILIGRVMLGTVLRFQCLRNTVSLAGWSLCTPRWVFDKVGGFNTDPSIAEDLQYCYDIELLGLKTYIPEIRVRSSLRRFTKNLKECIKHYAKLKTGFKEIFFNIIRPSKYPFKKILGLKEPDFYLAATMLALINIIRLL
jgi:glycosyltransferase involved in cell wall biosynthesis